MLPDIDRVTRLIEEAAAAEIMPRFRRLAEGDVREKAPGDLVTVADEAVEAPIRTCSTACSTIAQYGSSIRSTAPATSPRVTRLSP
jgi:hypothetical protein